MHNIKKGVLSATIAVPFLAFSMNNTMNINIDLTESITIFDDDWQTTENPLYKQERLCEPVDDWLWVCSVPHVAKLILNLLHQKDSIDKEIILHNNKLLIYKEKVLKDLFARLDNKESKIRTLYRYIIDNDSSQKKKKNENGRLLYVIIHGTFAQQNEHYWCYKSPIFNSVLKKIARTGRHYNADADIISWQWTGENSNRRIAFGKFLGHVINKLGKHYCKRFIFAHSHGGNIANAASHEVINTQSHKTIIDQAIYIATPVLEKNHWAYVPYHILELFHYYSKADPGQYFGSFNRQNNPLSLWRIDQPIIEQYKNNGSEFTPWKDTSRKRINIAVQDDGRHPGHSELVPIVMRDVFDINEKITKYYSGITSLSLNIFPEEKAKKHNIERLNISISPEVDLKKVDKKMVAYHVTQREAYKKVYGYEKDADSLLYLWWCLFRNLGK